jgi:hypothetical protein
MVFQNQITDESGDGTVFDAIFFEPNRRSLFAQAQTFGALYFVMLTKKFSFSATLQMIVQVLSAQATARRTLRTHEYFFTQSPIPPGLTGQPY